MMNNEPLWSQDDFGNYWLVFPNKQALGKEEIRNIFSKFGKVKNVTTAGNEKGLRFVQYTKLEDVENAVQSLRDHPSIKLIPHRPKNKKNANSDGDSKDNLSSNFNSQQAVPNSNNDKKPFSQQKSVIHNNLKNSCESISTNSDRKSIFEQMRNLKVSSTDNVSICSSTLSNSGASCGGQSLGNKSPARSFGTSSSPRLISPSNLFQKYKALQISRHSIATVESSRNNTITSDSILPQDDELPELITKPKPKFKCQEKRVFLKAEEVIVGNIHIDYGCAYILHLFEKFEPLAISYMQTVPKSDTRYCHVYFKTLQDSLNVETVFDKYNLSGQKLIVSRPCRLIEERS